MKFQSYGNFVQWMECTCPANRRSGEKCPHLAAFCLYLNHEKSQYLEKIQVPTSPSENYLGQLYQKLDKKKEEPKSDQEGFYVSKKQAETKTKSVAESGNFESIFISKKVEISNIQFDTEEPWINVSVVVDKSRKIAYRFGVDDTCKILLDSRFQQKASRDLLKKLNHGVTAKRFFHVQLDQKKNLVIQKACSFLKNGKEVKKIFNKDLASELIGKHGIFVKEIGFAPFTDQFSFVQLVRWEEYPKFATVAGDQVAELIASEFSHLRETAPVILDKSVEKIKVYGQLMVSDYSVKKLSDHSLLVDVDFRSENGKKQTNTILEILKARASGKRYAQTELGFIKITSDFDWLKGNIQKDGKVRLSSAEFVRFYNQIGEKSTPHGQVDVIEKIKNGLLSRENLDLPVFENTRLNLRAYQTEGLKWLWWLYQNGLGGLLADEMGLGKTHQTMALMAAIASKKSHARTLVVCPTSVMDHWLDKITQFIPKFFCIRYHGNNRRNFLEQLPADKPTVLITSYGILLRDIEFLLKEKWDLVVLDEAHLVKNQSTRTYKAACQLDCSMRLCLTGTPLENDLMELKNLFDYIAPNYLGSDMEFKKKYMSDELARDPMARIELNKLIHPFKMRRNKQDVLKDLPEKFEDVRYCYLNQDQMKLYNEILLLRGGSLIDELQNDKSPVPYIHIFSLISLLKQICDDPGLIDASYEHMGSGKLDLFDELLSEALESNQKVVVFSQYAKMVHKLSERLSQKKIKHVVLTGQSVKRGQIIKEFQENPNVQVFLGSLLAGGTGIDLTAANVVIHFDRWWNAAKEDQATGRIHRIGQVRNVQVYKLVTKGTLEERIDEIIARKKLLFEQFVEQDEQIFKHLSREDLLNLLKVSDQAQEVDPSDI